MSESKDTREVISQERRKLCNFAAEVRAVLEQGRAIERDPSKLFLFKGMYVKLSTYFDSYNATFDTLRDFAADADCSAEFPTKVDQQQQETIKRHFYEACAIYEHHMNPTPSASTLSLPPASARDSGAAPEQRPASRLPKIELPQFNGNPRDWVQFRDTYLPLIHNSTSISNMEKFLFLSSCLSGPARSIIANVKVCESNYAQAWSLLVEHYDNKRKLAHTYLKQALDFKPFTTQPTGSMWNKLVTTVIESLDSFSNLSIEDKGDFILSFLLLRLLDPVSRARFDKKHAGTDLPTYEQLKDFIKTEWKSMDMYYSESGNSSTTPRASTSNNTVSRLRREFKNVLFAGDAGSSDSGVRSKGLRKAPPCPACKANHSLYQCTTFKAASAQQKLHLLQGWKGCNNCLSGQHSAVDCPSLRRCTKCNQCHHSWLHVDPSAPALAPAPNQVPPANQAQGHSGVATAPQASEHPVEEGTTLSSLAGDGDVLLGTAIAEAKDSSGQFKPVRIVTDSGSQYSFITSDCARKLGLLIEPTTHNVCGIGQVQLPTAIGQLKCTIRSRISTHSHKELSTDVIVVPNITGPLPKTVLPVATVSRYTGYILADPEFFKPGPIEFLLGGDLFMDVITGKPLLIDLDIPRLLPTVFGFVVSGPLSSPTRTDGSNFLVQSQEDLKDIVQRFWEVEEVKPVRVMSRDDEHVEAHFKATHYRLPSGRYGVSLPVKDSISRLKSTHSQALKRFFTLEAKLEKDPKLKLAYHAFMREYLDLGHMRPTTFASAAYTLPHHAVVKQQDNDIKVRVVFDASCKSATGSLNDHLYTGPKLQHDICDILTHFRLHRVVFTADIVKMYRQIEVHPPDRKYQHVLWRFDPAEPIQEYELCTVTYGEGPAAYAAVRTLMQLAEDEGANYPLASPVLLEDFYVDDVCTGSSSLESAQALKSQLIELLSKGCFELSKWASNYPELTDSIPENELQLKPVSLTADQEPRIKLLGMQWIPNKDVFTYEVTLPPSVFTKRAILSSIARIFDPLGFLSPIVFYAKVLLQELWIAQCDWDEQGPPHICQRWQEFTSQLSSLSAIRIPRRFIHDDNRPPLFVGFSDASQRGYSAVLYLRSQGPDGPTMHLIKAKTKLAPTKQMTIPRLELSGALLLARLFKSCERLQAKLNSSEARFFTDSEVVLGWLSTPSRTMNTFVAHRVVLVLELTNRDQWSHVRSEHNPADCSSRGLLPSELVHHPLWWAGPSWATLPLDQWPRSDVRAESLPELKKPADASFAAVTSERPALIRWMEHFSSFPRMLRCLAYLRRFCLSFRKKLHPPTGPITIPELKSCTRICIRATQAYHEVDKKHLLSLSSYFDEDGLLRVGGRLSRSSLQHDAKHPFILSAKSHLAVLLVDHYHKTHLHLGPTALHAALLSRYWIVSARQLIRRRVFQCLKCYKEKKTPQAPLMSDLPAFRVTEGQVFNHVGVDYGGPFVIKESSRRKASLGKAYLGLFVCMTTKAVHLEVVSSCTTDAFLAALDRFIARRGRPEYIYSDCGTNFVGAANKLQELSRWHNAKATQAAIANHILSKEIQWTFNPPSAPHFGGIWEAGIKSAKTILYRLIGETPLTFEELSTMFCSIEAVLNSRPLTPVSTDPDNLECLTPGHFLIGRPLTAAPEEDLHDEKISPLHRWDLLKQRTQHFWSRWRKEYLNQLQQRRKWTSDKENLKEGDMVIIKEPNAPTRSWPLARVVSVHPGPDGVVRVATIKTSSGTYTRPVVKLVPLSIVNNPDA